MITHASLAQMIRRDKDVLFSDRIGCECCRSANQPLEIKGSSVPHPCRKERGNSLYCIPTVDQFTAPEDGFGTIAPLTRIDECRMDLVQGIQMTCEHHRVDLFVSYDLSQFYGTQYVRMALILPVEQVCPYTRVAYALKRVAPSTKNGIRRCT